MPRRLFLPCAVAAALLLAAGIVGVARTRADLSRRVSTVDGTPVELIRPAWSTSPMPGVVVVHGFSGSRQLMYSIGQTLARSGFVVAAIDLPGHGANTSRMGTSTAPGRAEGLQAAVASTVRWLRLQPGVAPDRIALVGHSMGAGVVIRFAAQRPDIVATVAISGAGNRLGPRPERPRNLLAMAGAWEFARVRSGTLATIQAAYPDAVEGRTYGRWEDGTARRAVFVPGVEHVGILFSRAAIADIVEWIGRSTGGPAIGEPVFAIPIPWVLVIYAGVALGFVPLAGLLFAAPATRGEARAGATIWPALPRAIALVVSLLAGVIFARFRPPGWIPLLTADYLALFFLAAGIAMFWALTLRPRRFTLAAPTAGLLWRTACVTLYAVGGFGLTAQFTWLDIELVGERQWLVLVLFPVWLVYFLADEIVHADLAGARRLRWYVGGKLLSVAAVLGATAAGAAPVFLLLLAPALVPMFLLHAYYSHWLNRFTGDPLPAALLNATVFAWLMAAVFPLS